MKETKAIRDQRAREEIKGLGESLDHGAKWGRGGSAALQAYKAPLANLGIMGRLATRALTACQGHLARQVNLHAERKGRWALKALLGRRALMAPKARLASMARLEKGARMVHRGHRVHLERRARIISLDNLSRGKEGRQ
jgi:hypothetical protein